MELRLLGPPELIIDGRSVDLGGPRQRVVLSMLGLNANRVTPVDQLIDAVWDDSPPSSARGQIQICISALRKLLGERASRGAIQTRSPGYLLEIAPEALDSATFARLVSEARAEAKAGRTGEADDLMRSALDLWRGPALAGVPSDLVQRGAALLEDRRLAAVEERIRLDLAIGRHEQIGGEIQALIDEHPLRERFYGFLMVALYRSGRQAESLEVARRARTVLINEVGVEPGEELRKLEHAILSRDPGLDLPAPAAPPPSQSETAQPGVKQATTVRQVEQSVVPCQLPASIADFTQRDAQVSEIKGILTAAASETASYAVRVVAISGRGGVGKTSLAVRAAHEVTDSFPDGHLYADFRASDDVAQTAYLLNRFLRALGVAGSAIPDDLAERSDLYRSRLAGKRVLVVLDDVTSEDQVLPLLPGSPECAVITTSRPRMSGLSGAHWIDVGVFDAEQSRELLAGIVGRARIKAEPDALDELVEFCGGLPLALRIAGARLASKPHWRISRLVHRLGDEARRLDEFAHRGLELRSSISLTYESLGEAARQLFRRFALVRAADFPAWTAAALLGTGVDEAEDVLETLVDAQVVEVVEQATEPEPRYRLHNLIHVYAREILAEEESEVDRDAALARVCGAWLALAEEAHRREYGGDFTILHGQAPRWLPAPFDELVDDSASWWEAERGSLVDAVRRAAATGLDELSWDLALTSVTLFETKGYYDDWRESTQLALEATRRAGNRRGEAAMCYSLGTLHMFRKHLDAAEEQFGQALEIFRTDGDDHGTALVLRNAAHVDRLQGRPAEMLVKYTEAIEITRKVGDRVAEAHILGNLARSTLDNGDLDGAQRMLEDGLSICQDVGCLRVEAQILYRFSDVYRARGRFELARQALHRVLRIVRDSGDQVGEAHALYGLGQVRFAEGRPDNATTVFEHALSLARLVSERLLEAQVLCALGEIAIVADDTALAIARLSDAHDLFSELGSKQWFTKTSQLLAGARTAHHKETASR